MIAVGQASVHDGLGGLQHRHGPLHDGLGVSQHRHGPLHDGRKLRGDSCGAVQRSRRLSSTTSWVAADAAFRVGIGTGDLNRKDALTVYKNDTVVISGDLIVAGSTVCVSSNPGRRLAALEASAEKQQQLKAEIKEQLKAEHEQLKAEHEQLKAEHEQLKDQLAEFKEELTQLAVTLAKK